MTTLAEAAALEFGFNPAQKRGPDGKWLFVGAAVAHAEHGVGEVVKTHMGGQVSVRFGRGVGVKKIGRRTTCSVP